MENYILYDEIGRGEHSVVYKGRKKGTIEFVAIHCVEKCKRFELRNIVRLTHEIEHPNVVKFHEWYETTNHIWMVVELCTGNSLDVVLSQDKRLPEDTIRCFGAEIAKALFHIHSLEILYCDLRPSRIMLDGSGVLKLSDFALARVEGEEDFYDSVEEEKNSEEEEKSYREGQRETSTRPKPSPHYMAPEILKGEPHSKASDLWSFGCVLHELFTGKQPFFADSFPELVTKIFHESPPHVNDKEVGAANGALLDLDDLIQSLLQKDPSQRLTWDDLISHRFWNGNLEHCLETERKVDNVVSDDALESQQEESIEISANENREFLGGDGNKNDEGVTSNADLLNAPELMVRQGTYTFSNKQSEKGPDNESLGKTKTLARARNSNNQDENTPRSSSQGEQTDVKISVCASREKEIKSTPLKKNQTFSKNDFNSEVRQNGPSQSEDQESKATDEEQLHCTGNILGQQSISDLASHPSDFTVTPIADNPKIKKFSFPKWDAKSLPCQPLKPGELENLPEEKFEEHLIAIRDLLSQNGKSSAGPMATLHRSKLHTSSYLASLCRDREIANLLFDSDFLSVVLKQIKSGFSADFKGRLGYGLSLLAANATMISEDFNMTEVFITLTEVIRDNFRNAKLKQHLLPALGEFLFYAATQEESLGSQITQWDVPGVTYTIITRCLHEGEDIVVQHFAAKTIENVATTTGRHCIKFATNDTAQLLWNFFTHCTVDAQKVTAITALSRLTSHSPSVFQHVLEKAGFKAVSSALSNSVSKVQQSLVTMFVILLSTRPQMRRLVQERDLITRGLHLLESPSVVIRGKVFLLVVTLVQSSPEALLHCCQSRLVMHIERQMKRGTPLKGESPDNRDYLTQCQRLCVAAVVDAAPGILTDVLTSLDAVQGRKHPSAGQAKQLRIHLPFLSIILHLVTSHAFRAQITHEEFLINIGMLLSHIISIESGTTSIGSAAGPNAAEDLTSVVLSITEAVTQHPPILLEYHAVVTEHVLPHLAALISSSNGDKRVLSFRMFADVASLYFDNHNFNSSSSKLEDVLSSTSKLNEVINDHLLPQYHLILQDQDPLPAYGLKLLLSFLERSPEIIHTVVKQELLVTMSQILQSHTGRLDRGMVQSIVGLLDCLVCAKDVDMSELFNQGLIDSLVSLFVDTADSQNDDGIPGNEAFVALLLPLLDLLNNTLKYVSREVRKALQAKTESNSESTVQTQLAEKLLVESKPLVDMTGVLINFLCHEETDIGDSACKCLYLMVELFGGIYKDALSAENMEFFAEALSTADIKKRKQLLRIIKRLLSANSQVSDVAREAQILLEVLQEIGKSQQSDAEALAVQSLVQEILVKLDVAK
ncbi:serine/threonine-protein kinase ULK4-like [Montipora foliosa]|uniref:serine/threonine-protein kinase ULK4-like n=1 Tax=Montipora foliosa TaxID=591990 RepID=UPI0035F19672